MTNVRPYASFASARVEGVGLPNVRPYASFASARVWRGSACLKCGPMLPSLARVEGVGSMNVRPYASFASTRVEGVGLTTVRP